MILGTNKPTASKLANGKYAASNTNLPQRYEHLIAVAAGQPKLGDICLDCPRSDCSGCRVADLIFNEE